MPASDSDHSNNGNDEYEVEAVVGRRRDANGNLEYLLKWKGFVEKTWEPVADCLCKKLIEEFESANPSPSRSVSSSSPRRASKRNQSKTAREEEEDESDTSSVTRGRPGTSATPATGKQSARGQKSSAASKSHKSRFDSASSDDGSKSPKKRQSRTSTLSQAISKAARDGSESSDEAPTSSKKTRTSRSSAKATRDDSESSEEAPTSSKKTRNSRSSAKATRDSSESSEEAPTSSKKTSTTRKSRSTTKVDARNKKSSSPAVTLSSGESDVEESHSTPVAKGRGAAGNQRTTSGSSRTRDGPRKNYTLEPSSGEEEEEEKGGKKKKKAAPTPARASARGKPAASSSEDEEEEEDVGSSSSRMAGRPPKRPSSMTSSTGGKASKKQPVKRARKSNSSSGSESSDGGSGSESGDERRLPGGGKRRKVEKRRSPIKRAPVNLSLAGYESTPEPDAPRRSIRRPGAGAESSSEDEEMEVKRAPPKTPKRVQHARRPVVDSSDEDEDAGSVTRVLMRRSGSDGSTTGRVNGTAPIGRVGRPPAKVRSLEEVLTSTLVADPYVVPVALSPGKKSVVAGRVDENATRAPPKIFRPEELPGLDVWMKESYEAEFVLPKTLVTGAVERFAGRDVERVVGFVMHPTHPFVLVKLALKNNEKTINVKDAVQGVHAHLASLLMPKAFADYTCRMAQYQQSVGAADAANEPSSSNGRRTRN